LNAVLGYSMRVALGLAFVSFPAISARAQESSAHPPAQAVTPPPAEEHRLTDSVKFLTGAALALVAHEGGHVVFDAVFGAKVDVVAIHFGPFPFFAVSHPAGLPPREEFTISSAGFWVQEAGDEWMLTSRPNLRAEHAPLLKGMLAFNVLNSVGYAIVAFAEAGPYERDTRGMAQSIGVSERGIGAVILAPALLDAYRYYRPNARWAVWASRAAKVGSVLLVLKRP
jgi:hypothetical protein